MTRRRFGSRVSGLASARARSGAAGNRVGGDRDIGLRVEGNHGCPEIERPNLSRAR